MKIAILGDLHIGAGKRDEWTEKNQHDFLFNFFFPKIKELGINIVIQTGDFFDDRKSIAHPSIEFANSIIEHDSDVFWHVIVGNHDMHLKDVVYPNACSEILGHHSTVKVYSEPTTVDIGHSKIDMIPWICKSNRERINQFVALSESKYAVGHFELVGFKFYPGITAKHGDDPNFLNKYERVLTGHYHTPTQSDNGKIVYVGTPYTLTFNDANDARGFHVFDTDTGELEFHENPVCHHIKFEFDADVFEPSDDEGAVNQKAWIQCINPINKKREVNFDTLLEKWAAEFGEVRVDYEADLKLIDDVIDEAGDTGISNKSSLQYISEHINNLDIDDEVKERLRLVSTELYKTAQSEMNVGI